jgi:hypothetical protein
MIRTKEASRLSIAELRDFKLQPTMRAIQQLKQHHCLAAPTVLNFLRFKEEHILATVFVFTFCLLNDFFQSVGAISKETSG